MVYCYSFFTFLFKLRYVTLHIVNETISAELIPNSNCPKSIFGNSGDRLSENHLENITPAK